MEANGLLDSVTKMHVTCFNELGTDKWVDCYEYKDVARVFSRGYTFIGHNIIGYDFPVYDKLYGLQYFIQPDMINDTECQIIDTLVLSRELNPDRIGGHGLAAWQKRVQGHKPIVEDWQDQDIQIYLDRCRNDVILTGNVLEVLLKEAGVQI